MTEENWQYKWERDCVNFFITRKNGNREVISHVQSASKYFALVKTREGSDVWVHSVNGHIMEVDHPDKMAELQQNFKRVDEQEI